MCSCLFIIDDVLPFAGTMKKEDKEELYSSFKYFITLKKCKNMRIMFEKLYGTQMCFVQFLEHDLHIFAYNIFCVYM